MALNDNPGVMTMPKSERDWTKFVNDLAKEFQTTDQLEEAEALAYFISED